VTVPGVVEGRLGLQIQALANRQRELPTGFVVAHLAKELVQLKQVLGNGEVLNGEVVSAHGSFEDDFATLGQESGELVP